MPITALPTPPSRDDPANFAARGDAFLGALPTFVTEANAQATAVNADKAAADVSASGALASQNAAATSASNAATHKTAAQAAQTAAESAAIAAGASAGIPSATGYNQKVLRVTGGIASWQWAAGLPKRIHAAPLSDNQLSSTGRMGIDLAAWSKGTQIASVAGGYDGHNGFGFVRATVTSASNTYIAQVYTPANGQTKTFSVSWRGSSKPSTGALLSMNYRDAGGTLRTTDLQFSDASVIADGQWRRYSVTTTHASATTSGCQVFILDSAPAGVYDYCDPQVNDGATATEVVCVDTAPNIDHGHVFHVDSSGAAVTVYPKAPAVGDWFGLVDSGQAAATNNVTVNRGTASIMGLAENMACNVNCFGIRLVYQAAKGWVVSV